MRVIIVGGLPYRADAVDCGNYPHAYTDRIPGTVRRWSDLAWIPPWSIERRLRSCIGFRGVWHIRRTP